MSASAHIQDDWELSDEHKRRLVHELANLANTEQWLQIEPEVARCRNSA